MTVSDVYELAAHLVGIDPDDEGSDVEIEEKFADRFGIDLDQFGQIVGALLPLIDVAEGHLSGIVYQGFSAPVPGARPGVRRWLARVERGGSKGGDA